MGSECRVKGTGQQLPSPLWVYAIGSDRRAVGSESCVRVPSFPRTTSARKPKKHLTGGASGWRWLCAPPSRRGGGAGPGPHCVARPLRRTLGLAGAGGRGGRGRSRSGRSFNLSQLKEPCWFSRALTSSFRGPHVVMSTLLNRSIVVFFF